MKKFKQYITEAPWDDEYRTPWRPTRDQLIDRGVRPELLDRPWNPEVHGHAARVLMLIWLGVPLAVIAWYIPLWMDLLLLMFTDVAGDESQENEWGLNPQLTHPTLTPWFFDPNFLQLIEDGLMPPRDAFGRQWSVDNPPPGWWMENNQWNNDPWDPSLEGHRWDPVNHEWVPIVVQPKWNFERNNTNTNTGQESDAIVPLEPPDMPRFLPTVNHPRM